MKLPTHPEPHTYQWTALELRAIEEYGDARVAQSLSTTSVIEPVAASIDTPEFRHHAELLRRESPASYNFMALWDSMIQRIDAHCAAQVAQAVGAKAALTENLVGVKTWIDEKGVFHCESITAKDFYKP